MLPIKKVKVIKNDKATLNVEITYSKNVINAQEKTNILMTIKNLESKVIIINSIRFDNNNIKLAKKISNLKINAKKDTKINLVIEPISSITPFISNVFLNEIKISLGKFQPTVIPFKTTLGEVNFYQKLDDNALNLNIQNIDNFDITLTNNDITFSGLYKNKFYLRNSPIILKKNKITSVPIKFNATDIKSGVEIFSDINLFGKLYGVIKTKTQILEKFLYKIINPDNFYQTKDNLIEIELTNKSKQSIYIYDNLNKKKLITYAGENQNNIKTTSEIPIKIETNKSGKIIFNMDASKGVIGTKYKAEIIIDSYDTITKIPISLNIINFKDVIIKKNKANINKYKQFIDISLQLDSKSKYESVFIDGFTMAGKQSDLYKFFGLAPRIIPKNQPVILQFEVDPTKLEKNIKKMENIITIITDKAPLMFDISLNII